MRRSFTFALVLGLGSMAGCTALMDAIEGKSAADADEEEADPEAVDAARRDAIRFISDVVAQHGVGGDTDRSHVTLGPRVYARILERDPTFETLGTRVRVSAPGRRGPPRTSSECSDQQCEEYLKAEGLRATLRPYAAAEFRTPTDDERQDMDEWAPKTLPDSALPLMAVLDGDRMAFYVSGGTVMWFELMSREAGRPEQSGARRGAGAKINVKRTLQSLQCVKLTGVDLGGSDEEFDRNTDSSAMAEGVARVMKALDDVLYEQKSTAQGPWSLHVTFGLLGILHIDAPPKADVEASVAPAVGERMAGQALYSEQAVLSLKLDVALRPCAE
ncbi:MAG: hypothetical protein JW940_07805 [Polyangiaceae bacterium]|nr:hypothetical protein [Polyangiaceae bacterium]